MDKMTILEVADAITGDVVEYALIENADGSFTSMPKSVYDAQQVEHLTEIPTPKQSGTL